ncbi:enoyl-CoA hydratase/isomerase family protein [Microbacterium sp. NPDC055910]|uniref:enoyl-CoA hydratase/isomerase family protein n=1 Tax=Microbacterium sp. NPDC055910 TaxID=3345659 RepID=UPI0035DC717F
MTSVALEIDAGVATLTLSRPATLNAFDLDLAAELVAAVADVARSDAEVVILAGEGRAFSAGGDVRAMAGSGDPAQYLRELTRDIHAALAALRELPIPVIARVHGAVAGGGLGLVLAADIVVAGADATFTAAYGAIGLSPDCGVTALLPDIIGAGRARAFLVGGRRIDAATAMQWGLVHTLVLAEGLDEAVAEAVENARRAGSASVAATKALLSGSGYREHMEREATVISYLAGTTAAARIAAFAGAAGNRS